MPPPQRNSLNAPTQEESNVAIARLYELTYGDRTGFKATLARAVVAAIDLTKMLPTSFEKIFLGKGTMSASGYQILSELIKGLEGGSIIFQSDFNPPQFQYAEGNPVKLKWQTKQPLGRCGKPTPSPRRRTGNLDGPK